MSYYHHACKDCVLNHDCLFQSNNNVEDCSDVEHYEEENNE